jgi:hypothetical protein
MPQTHTGFPFMVCLLLLLPSPGCYCTPSHHCHQVESLVMCTLLLLLLQVVTAHLDSIATKWGLW